ncbi:MAG: DMT family transporter [Rhodobacteraceae bacterium]|nr:DMT family transporter [Paracoccaceae bacterium]
MGVLFALIWSSAFTTGWIVVQAIEPFTALTIRFALSGFLALGLALLLGQPFPHGRRQWRAILIFGLFQNGIYLGANWTAMQWIDASLGAIIGSTMPLQVALLGGILLRDRLGWVGNIGLVTGFLGVLVIMWPRLDIGYVGLGILLCLLAALALSIATLVARSATSGGNIMMIVGLQMLVGCALTAIPAVLFETMTLPVWTPDLAFAFLYQVMAPGILATWIWFALVQRIGPTRASSFHYLNPFLGVAVATVVLDEHMGVIDLAGVLVITIGIILVNNSRGKRPKLI